MSIATLITGGNIGDTQKVLDTAREVIQERVGRVLASSSMHHSVAWGFEGDDFLNQVLIVQTDLGPMDLLDATQSIERELGRTKKSVAQNYESRVIDIDILYYDELIVNNERLTLPHPRINERDFVLIPLAQARQKIDIER